MRRTALERRRLFIVFGGMMLAMALGALDQAIVATALPTIVADLGGLEQLPWVVTSYLIAATAATPLWGKLGDLYGRKRTFLATIVIFLVGSALCGASQTMLQLVAARAVQGIGGGGLIVTSQAVIGDIVSPRERGRYQGIFGAVFALSSVVGPALGGFVVEHLSWHWIFFINLPIGAAALLVIALALPPLGIRVRHRIDYLGAALMTGATTSLVLVLTLGGGEYAWGSPLVIMLGAVGVGLSLAFVLVEQRVEEPILPLRLFDLRNFRVCGALSFLIGGALLGPVTILPLFFQVVYGASPTESGTRLLPLLLSIPVASVVSGQVISRTGRYRRFPIGGTALICAGFFLMTQLEGSTTLQTASLYLMPLGIGLGMTMQVLVLAVQNAVEYRDLGAATSGIAFSRSMGSVFGVALFGALFTSQVAARAAEPAADAYVAAINVVFSTALIFGFSGFLLAWRLEEVPLRETARALQPESPITPPLDARSSDEVERILSMMLQREARQAIYESLASRAGVPLPPIGCWLLFRLGEAGPSRISELAAILPLPALTLRERFAWLEELGYVSIQDDKSAASDPQVELTAEGHRAVERLARARRERLEAAVRGWHPERYPELEELLRRLALVLVPDVTVDQR